MKIFFSAILLFSIVLTAQNLKTPLEQHDYKKVTSHAELLEFVNKAAAINPNIKMEYIAESVEGRKIPALKISSSEFGADDNKIKVLIFAQQHGNEQSGKEGALLLLRDISENKLNEVLSNVDLLLVPQMNPDGSEVNKRRNGNDMDLNRNHLILTEPETIGLHKLFNSYYPEMTLDVHEYYPFTDDWKSFGYIKMWDEQFGTTTNPNVSSEIRRYSEEGFLSFAKEYLEERNFTFNNYLLGGPPNEFRFRHSTYDINDGRQSLGILNSFSFILEGLNGDDAYVSNIKHRAEGQAAAMHAFLTFASDNKDKIKKLVEEERNKLVSSSEGEIVTIRMEHVKGDKSLTTQLRSVYSGKDTTITLEEYHSDDKSILDVKKPLGYLLPKSDARFKTLLDNHAIKYSEYEKADEHKLFQYHISKIDSIELEETVIADPIVEKKEVKSINTTDYFFVSINQLHSNMLVLAFEPQSMLGLVVYDKYKNLIEPGKEFPILRVETK